MIPRPFPFRMLIALAPLLTISTGCVLTPTFTTGYQVAEEGLVDRPFEGELAVQVLEDARPERYYSSAGRMFQTYIPIVPYVSMPFERLEESVQIQSADIESRGLHKTSIRPRQLAPPFEEYSYPQSFARAIVEDLSTSGIFESVALLDEREEFGEQSSFDAPAAGEGLPAEDLNTPPLNRSRYLLSGTLRQSEYRTTTTSFGLGVVGVLLWIVPIPIQKASAEVELDLVLTDQQTNRVIWKKRIEESLRRYVTMYGSSAMTYGKSQSWSLAVMPPPSGSKVDSRSLFSWHFEALRRGMLKARGEIVNALSNRHQFDLEANLK